jgi:hypothetical protein
MEWAHQSPRFVSGFGVEDRQLLELDQRTNGER